MKKHQTIKKNRSLASRSAKLARFSGAASSCALRFPLRKTLRVFLAAAAAFTATADRAAAEAVEVVAGENLREKIGSAPSDTLIYDLLGDVIWKGTPRVDPAAKSNITLRGWDKANSALALRVIEFQGSIRAFTLDSAAETLNINYIHAKGNGGDSGDGLFYVNSGSANVMLNLEGSTFSGFYASDSHRGGVLSGTSGQSSSYTVDGGVRGAVFEGNHSNKGNNESTSGGGAITVRSGNSLTLQGNLTFRNNFSYLFGGAIALASLGTDRQYLTSTEDSSLLFEGNWARAYGGALDVWGYPATLLFQGTTAFKNNFVFDDTSSGTGARDNEAKRGGAINIGEVALSSDVYMTFEKTALFENNYVIGFDRNGTNGDAYGGALSAYRRSGSRSYKVTFNGAAIFRGNYVVAPNANRSAHGGAIFYEAPSAELTLGPGSEFRDNFAQTLGGAVYLKSGSITLKASAAGDIIFQGNKQGVSFSGSGHTYAAVPDSGVPNAVYFGTGGTFVVDAADGGKVEFYDPIYSSGGVTFEKTGTGSVIFYDYGSLTGMTSGSPVTNVKGGFFILKLSENPPAGAEAAYGTLGMGTINVSGDSESKLGVIVGENNAKLQAHTINVNAHGEIWADDPSGTFLIKASAFTLKNDGGIGGSGTMRVEDEDSDDPMEISTVGTFIIKAIDRNNPGDASAVFTLDGPFLKGAGKLKKTGPGLFEVDRAHTYGGGTQVESGTLLVTYTGAKRRSSESIGGGAVVINENGTLYAKPKTGGDYEINNILSAHNSGAAGGLLRVDLGATDNVLTFADSTNYDGRLLLENLTYIMIQTTGAARRQLAGAKVEAGAGALLHVNAGNSDTAGFKFAGGAVRFNDMGADNPAYFNSRIRTGSLDVSGTGAVQIDGASHNQSLFTNNGIPLLQRDNYGFARRLIGSKSGAITVTGDAADIKLVDFNGAEISANQTADLIQNTETVAVQYLRLGSVGITTGPHKDGLYLGAVLYRLHLHSGKTTVLSGDVADVAGGADFSAQITGGGNLRIDAANSIILNNADPDNPNTYTGKTTVNTGRLAGGADNVIAASGELEVKAGAIFDTGNFNQKADNLTGGGTVEVNTTGEKKLTISETVSTSFSGVLAGGGNIEKTGAGTLTLGGTANTHNGNWTISGGGVAVAGLLGSGGNFSGGITIKNASSLVFAQAQPQTPDGWSAGNFQVLAGALTGNGTLEKTGEMPLYFSGDASTFSGTTAVNGGSFHINTTAAYGSTTAAGSFSVAGDAALYVGDGGKIVTKTMRLAADATLVSNPGRFVIRAESAQNIEISAGASFVFRLGTNDLDTEANPLSKVAFENAAGAAAGVKLTAPAGLKVLPAGYMPQPTLDGHFTLMSGLDVSGIAALHGSYDDALLAIFGFKELKIMESRFKLYFTGDGKLMLDQMSYTAIPEPPAYALFGGVFLGAITLLRRRRRNKHGKV